MIAKFRSHLEARKWPKLTYPTGPQLNLFSLCGPWLLSACLLVEIYPPSLGNFVLLPIAQLFLTFGFPAL